MRPTEELVSHRAYIQSLRSDLPLGAFAAQPKKLWQLLAHLLVVIGGYLLIRQSESQFALACLSIITAHSLGCIAFLAHELSHNTIIRNRQLRYVLEVAVWALNLIPATVWKRVHNHTHHLHTNTSQDPDRKFLESENTFLTRWYSNLFYPHRYSIRWNPLVAFHFVPYILRNTLAVFYSDGAKPTLVPSKPVYSARQRVNVAFEMSVIVLIQIVIFHVVGSRWTAYLWASPVAIALTSGLVMTYVFTNHFMNPLGEMTDPISATTSVIVPVFSIASIQISPITLNTICFRR